jgi:16S rRNA (adenine1518-N6/adenine1519-N6)-dimethyltransferase
MNLPPLKVTELLRKYGLAAKKSLGQNFLIDNVALTRIVTAAEISKESTVLEIGAGLGSLTRLLAESAGKVVAVELDKNLLPILKEVLSPWENVSLVHGDILELEPDKLMDKAGYLVVANIPYYITSAVIRHLLESGCKPSRLVLTVQQEVARRICASAGEMSLLALSVQVYGNPVVVAHIPCGAFFPAPKVDSSVVRVDLYPESLIDPEKIHIFFRLIKAGFSQKRKTLRNSLSAGLHLAPEKVVEFLQEAGIDPQRRAQSLDLSEWKNLVQKVLL